MLKTNLEHTLVTFWIRLLKNSISHQWIKEQAFKQQQFNLF